MGLYLNIFEASSATVCCNKYKLEDNAWMTNDIRISCKKKRSLYLLTRNCDNSEAILHCKHYCSILRKTAREAKRQYFNELIVNSENKVKTTWKIIKKLTNKHQHYRKTFPQIKIEGIEKPPNQVVQDINNYFLNITGNLNLQATKNSNCIPLLEKYYPDKFPPMQTVPVTEGEIRCIINSVKPKISSGYDGI